MLNCRIISLLLFFSLPLLVSTQVQARMYLCENSRGVLEYTNVRGAGNCKSLQKERYWSDSDTITTTSYGNYKYERSGWSQPSLYDDQIRRIGAQHNVDSCLIKAVIRIESDFNFLAVSKKGAQGLMQLMPATARELNVKNPFDPVANIDGGTRYLKQLLETFNGDLPLALAAYNAGPTLVKSKNRIPRIPETIKYVRNVLGRYRYYKKKFSANAPDKSVINIRKLVTN